MVQPRIKPGTRLVREWRGDFHKVLVTETGYEYSGVGYQSLSEIARKVMGTRWSGRDSEAVRRLGLSRPTTFTHIASRVLDLTLAANRASMSLTIAGDQHAPRSRESTCLPGILG